MAAVLTVTLDIARGTGRPIYIVRLSTHQEGLPALALLFLLHPMALLFP
jgi:hypothetical protein